MVANTTTMGEIDIEETIVVAVDHHIDEAAEVKGTSMIIPGIILATESVAIMTMIGVDLGVTAEIGIEGVRAAGTGKIGIFPESDQWSDREIVRGTNLTTETDPTEDREVDPGADPGNGVIEETESALANGEVQVRPTQDRRARTVRASIGEQVAVSVVMVLPVEMMVPMDGYQSLADAEVAAEAGNGAERKRREDGEAAAEVRLPVQVDDTGKDVAVNSFFGFGLNVIFPPCTLATVLCNRAWQASTGRDLYWIGPEQTRLCSS